MDNLYVTAVKFDCFFAQIHALNGQGDYLSAKARSRMVVCCNITAFICIFVSDALMLTIIVYICKSLKSLFQAIDE